MKEYEEQTSTTSEGAAAQTTKASQQLERTDLLLSELRADLRMGRGPEAQTWEQRAALALAEAALDTYVSFFYSPGSGQ
jgi:hypothetical protein